MRSTILPSRASPILLVIALAIASALPGPLSERHLATAQEPITDAQIAGVVLCAAATGITQAELALRKASDPAVKRFAETMVTDQVQLDQNTLGMLARLGMRPTDSPRSQAWIEESRATIDELALTGEPQFDRAYLEAQIADHRRVLAEVDRLTPQADHPEVRALLASARPLVQTHLEHAERLASELTG